MNESSDRVSGFLFGVTLLMAGILLTAVVASPWFVSASESPSDLLLLFGRDMTVRRTGFFCSVGLMATAFIFFRPAILKKKKTKDKSVNMTGA